MQIFSNVGYFILAGVPTNLPLMYAATGFELLTSGMGTGAYSVLLLRMTQKRFSATQYALFSSLMGLPRLLAGPISGFVVAEVGWRTFYLTTLGCGIPGMILLSRFVPLGTREPHFSVAPPHQREPLGGAQLMLRGTAGAAGGVALGGLLVASLDALRSMVREEGARFDLVGAFQSLLQPSSGGDYLRLAGLAIFGLVCGLFTAAVAAARHGAGANLATDDEDRDGEAS